ncbi:MAG: glycosyltransferase [Candidatus Lindowbacteria bacterium]|nr:glycosyltransferase [Candidatus Lindowbacteria bacterium]
MNENPSRSLPTASAFAAYELAFAAGLVFFAPHALLRMLGTPSYRAGIGQRLSLQGGISELPSRPVWIQAVSLGEVKSVTPLIRKINDDNCPVFLTTTTETGFRVARELHGAGNAVSYFPLDLTPVVKRVLTRVRPRAIVLFETEICGNMKFDAAPTPPSLDEIEKLRLDLALEGDTPLIVAGSTHEGEDEAVLRAYADILSKSPKARLLIAPRHPERFDAVEELIKGAGFRVRRRSRPARGAGAGGVILLDTVGELARVYAMASVSFVGGSLAKVGGHNIIEPASMGKPVLFGPHMHHFEDVKEAFLSDNAAICVRDHKELSSAIARLIENPSCAAELGEAAMRVVAANRGATDRYFEALRKYLG